MNSHNPTFDWLDFAEGRARFCGGVRGAKQQGCEAFAVELAGRTSFGEIRKHWPDGEHFNLEAVTFGHTMIENIGLPISPDSPLIAVFTSVEPGQVQSLVQQLVAAFLVRQDRPFVMSMDSADEFLGKGLFADGWALVSDGGTQVEA